MGGRRSGAGRVAGSNRRWWPRRRAQTGSALMIFLVLSMIVEKAMHFVEKQAQKKEKWFGIRKGLKAFKEEFFLLGFVSMVLVALEDYITDICVDGGGVVKDFIPCDKRYAERYAETYAKAYAAAAYPGPPPAAPARSLLAAVYQNDCPEGMAPFIQPAALHDVHYLIFINGVMHVLTTLVVMYVAFAKVNSRRWREWEIAARRAKPAFDSERGGRVTVVAPPERPIFSNLGEKHAWYRSALRFLVALPTHVWSPVEYDEYKVIRAIFVANTFNKDLYSSFSFQNFMYLSLQRDFSKLMTLSIPMWLLVFLRVILSGVEGAVVFYWFPFLGLLVGTVLGAKLNTMVMDLGSGELIWDKVSKGFQVDNDHSGAKLFWFGSPALLSMGIRFVIFHGSTMLSLIAFFWYQTDKGDLECWFNMMGTHSWIAVMVIVVVVIQLLHCGFILIPLNSLVQAGDTAEDPEVKTQKFIMDSMANREQVEAVAKIWHLKTKLHAARKRKESAQSDTQALPLGPQRTSSAAGDAASGMASARADARRLTINEVQMSCLMSAMSEPEPNEGRGSLTMPVLNPLCDPP